jgi:hypothetical protein
LQSWSCGGGGLYSAAFSHISIGGQAQTRLRSPSLASMHRQCAHCRKMFLQMANIMIRPVQIHHRIKHFANAVNHQIIQYPALIIQKSGITQTRIANAGNIG